MKLGLNLPLNSVSFGQTSLLLLKTLFEQSKQKEIPELYLFPIGQIDLSSQQISEEFKVWLQHQISRAFEFYVRDIPMFKLWHLNGSLESYSKNQTLLSFYELDSPTKVELNIAKNNRICFSSEYTRSVFDVYGVKSQFLPLAFDSFSFRPINKKYSFDERVVFNICGKLERRKHHAKMIQAWTKKWGKNPNYFLQCATYNPFLGSNQQECDQNNNNVIRQIIGEKPFNVNFYPMMRENALYNDFLNSADIILGMSGGEGWGLPEFHSVAMGKHAVLLEAHGYTTWATKDMVTFVKPSGKISSVDNMFFKQGEPFNQGMLFDWNEDEFIAACEESVKKVLKNRQNVAGLSLQTTFSKERLVKSIIDISLSSV